MRYYLAKSIHASFDQAVEKTTAALKDHGFGILTDIDARDVLKKKLGVDFRRYRILGACNPPLAHRALQAEDKIGTMLPCNVVVQDLGDGKVEVAVIDPLATMASIGNAKLVELASTARERLVAALDDL